MNEMKPEGVMRALDLFHQRILETKLAEKIYEEEIMAIIHARYLILKHQVEAREKDAEIERLKHSKGVAQVNIINEISNRMRIKEFNSHDIATGYAWAINDLLKLLLELKKRVMRCTNESQCKEGA